MWKLIKIEEKTGLKERKNNRAEKLYIVENYNTKETLKLDSHMYKSYKEEGLILSQNNTVPLNDFKELLEQCLSKIDKLTLMLSDNRDLNSTYWFDKEGNKFLPNEMSTNYIMNVLNKLENKYPNDFNSFKIYNLLAEELKKRS